MIKIAHFQEIVYQYQQKIPIMGKVIFLSAIKPYPFLKIFLVIFLMKKITNPKLHSFLHK